MDFDDDDLLDDSEKPARKPGARAGGRFKPRAKPKTAKTTTLLASSPSATQSTAQSNQPLKENEAGSAGLVEVVSSNVGTACSLETSIQSADILEYNMSAPPLTNSSDVVASDALDSEAQDSNLNLGKPATENADIFSGLESLDDLVTQSTDQDGAAGNQSQQKVGMDALCMNNDVTSHLVYDDGVQLLSSSERPTHITPSDKEPEDNGAIPAQIYFDDSAFKVFEPIDDVEAPDVSEGTVASGRRARKFQPKPRVETGKQKLSADISNPDSDSANCLLNPLQTKCVEGSIPAVTPNGVFEYSSMNLGNSVPSDPSSSKLGLNEDVANVAETSQPNLPISGDNVYPEDVSDMTEKVNSEQRKRKSSRQSKKSKNFSMADAVNEDGKSSKRLRKKVDDPQLVDQPEDDNYDDDSFPAGPSTSSTMNEGEDDGEDSDDEYITELSRKKEASKKPKKPVAENKKQAKRRKKTDESQDQPNLAPRKKFSHSTRRGKRTVDKALLQTPEEEIDFQRIPIKDLILYAEHKDRLAKEGKSKTLSTPSTNQCDNDSLSEEETHNAREEYHSEDDSYASEQNEDFIDNQANYKSKPTYFNYQSYMKKAPSSRWSKQDTEIFYEAIQQFGTDFSMIQQLFPGKTRHQVKLKYKKEQRQHPLRLSQAETHRTKDHFHFERVIEQLQQAAAARAEQEADGDESIGLVDDDTDQMATETNDEATKTELNENVAAENTEVAAAEVHSAPKPAVSDDDDDVWDTYKSEY